MAKAADLWAEHEAIVGATATMECTHVDVGDLPPPSVPFKPTGLLHPHTISKM